MTSEEESPYLFRFDTAPEPVVFGGEADLTGWLLRRDEEAITGLRAVIRRPLRPRKIQKARRKRTRRDVAAVFPDSAEALKSGFLFELRLGFGPNRITFEAQNQDRTWQAFARTRVWAYPLRLFNLLGLPRLRETLVTQLRRYYLGSYRTSTLGAEASTLTRPVTRPASLPRRIDLFATSRSNLFIQEIGQLVAAGFRELGCAAELHLDKVPDGNPTGETMQIVVTPHEFYNLFLREKLPRAEMRALTRGVILLCTEQPETVWFQSNLQWAPFARGVADINPLGVAAYAARGLPATHLHLGYHPLLGAPELPHYPKRRYDLTFLGSLTPRRDKFLAENAPFFAERRCHLRLVPITFAKTEKSRSYLTVDDRNSLLSQSRLLLNVHYSERKYFEWHRMLLALANGCCIVTETCHGYGSLVPGKHFVMVEPEDLIAACRYYLDNPGAAEAIARAGLDFVRNELRQSQTCGMFLEVLEKSSQSRSAEEAFAGTVFDHPAAPLPEALLQGFRQQNRRRLVDALTRDFRNLFAGAAPEPTEPTSQPPEAARAEVLRKREGYRSRLLAQEEARARGEEVLTIKDNAAFSQTTSPRLSVVITLYNYAQHLRACVDSLTAAAHRLDEEFEILIVNDASTDSSLALAMKLQGGTSLPIRIVDKRLNTGLADARNTGITVARAPYVFMLDADNLIFPSALGELLDLIRSADYDAAYSMLCRFRGQPGNRVGMLSYYDFDPEVLTQFPYIDAMAMFKRATLLELGGYDNQLSQIGWFGWEDYDMWLRFVQQGRQVAFLPNLLCLYRNHGTSMINTTNLFAVDLGRHFIQRYGDLLKEFEPREKVFGVPREKLHGILGEENAAVESKTSQRERRGTALPSRA